MSPSIPSSTVRFVWLGLFAFQVVMLGLIVALEPTFSLSFPLRLNVMNPLFLGSIGAIFIGWILPKFLPTRFESPLEWGQGRDAIQSVNNAQFVPYVARLMAFEFALTLSFIGAVAGIDTQIIVLIFALNVVNFVLNYPSQAFLRKWIYKDTT